MSTNAYSQDVMQVCRNGHVITDLLHAFPERGASHCERCGAPTVERCQTCGQEIRGAVHVPGLEPIGQPEAPQFCVGCGASFPWTSKPVAAAVPETPLAALERMLRRLPRVIRQLRVRQGDRPAFRVTDERDLEDLMRSLLPLCFDDVRPESRTASYSTASLTDFLLEPHNLVLTLKRTRSKTIGEKELALQVQEDSIHYDSEVASGTLVCFVYDPEAILRDRPQLERAWSRTEGALEVRCVIA